jgi:hypothetical protein
MKPYDVWVTGWLVIILVFFFTWGLAIFAGSTYYWSGASPEAYRADFPIFQNLIFWWLPIWVTIAIFVIMVVNYVYETTVSRTGGQGDE